MTAPAATSSSAAREPGAGDSNRPTFGATAFSWFAPLVLAAGAIAVVMFYLGARREPISTAVVVEHRPRIILIACDGLRRDRLSLLGYPRPTTPNLDRFASLCAVLPNAVAAAPTTLASHATIVTGTSPRKHFARHEGQRIPLAAVTLAERLRNAGFATAAFVDSAVLSRGERGAGFDAGFDLFDDAIVPGDAAVNGFARYFGALRDWLLRNRGGPTFTYVECRAPCGPWDPEEADSSALSSTAPVVPGGAERFGDPMRYIAELSAHDALRPERYATLAAMVDAYDAAVRRFDRQLGAFLGLLAAEGLFDDAFVIVTAAHGYSLFDRQLYVGNGLTVFEEEIGVPLFLKFPRGQFAGVRRDQSVGLVDLYATICEVAGVAPPSEVDSRSMIPLLTGEETEDRIVSGEAVNLAAIGIDGIEGYTFFRRHGPSKVIAPSRIGPRELFGQHLDRDDPTSAGYSEDRDPLQLRARYAFDGAAFDLLADPCELAALADGVARLRGITAEVAAAEERAERQRERYRGANVEVDPPRDTDAAAIDELVRKGYISSEEGEKRKAGLRRR